jgi:hypothetical protein
MLPLSVPQGLIHAPHFFTGETLAIDKKHWRVVENAWQGMAKFHSPDAIAERQVKENLHTTILDLASGNSVVKYSDWMGVKLVARQV